MQSQKELGYCHILTQADDQTGRVSMQMDSITDKILESTRASKSGVGSVYFSQWESFQTSTYWVH